MDIFFNFLSGKLQRLRFRKPTEFQSSRCAEFNQGEVEEILKLGEDRKCNSEYVNFNVKGELHCGVSGFRSLGANFESGT